MTHRPRKRYTSVSIKWGRGILGDLGELFVAKLLISGNSYQKVMVKNLECEHDWIIR